MEMRRNQVMFYLITVDEDNANDKFLVKSATISKAIDLVRDLMGTNFEQVPIAVEELRLSEALQFYDKTKMTELEKYASFLGTEEEVELVPEHYI